MGNNCSSLENIAKNEYLCRLCGNESINENDPFWNSLLAFSLVDLDLVAVSSSNSKLLEDTVMPLCKNMSINNVKTGNFHTQVNYFIRRLDEVITHEVSDSENLINPFTWQVLNCLFIIRNICKYFVCNLSEEVIIQQFLRPDAGSSDSGPDNTISNFIGSLTKGLTQLPVHETTILLHLEMVNTLLAILGMVMYDSDCATNNVFYIEIMEGESSKYAVPLTKSLLTSYAMFDKLPSYIYKTDEASSLSSTLWSVMTLGMSGSARSEVKHVNHGLQSLLLLLVLSNHPYTGNMYTKTLATLIDDDKQPLVKPEVGFCTFCLDIDSIFY
ncbi:DYM [Bugula neritina]|uniref:Dymeclin n=1 Tax=Bugula neritina TaxID=10212 RepID=A0A7J7J0X0_BUGNE|nr:DYM [Bugula neritina]